MLTALLLRPPPLLLLRPSPPCDWPLLPLPAASSYPPLERCWPDLRPLPGMLPLAMRWLAAAAAAAASSGAAAS
jgi:hypothetical protein